MSKKFSDTSRFVVSSQIWMNTIPTRDCDILMTLPKGTEDDTLMWLLERLRVRAPELSVRVRFHKNTETYGFYFTTAFENLMHGAEELSMRKSVKAEYGGGMKEFVCSDKEYFEDILDQKNFFTTQERQSIVKNMLDNVRAQEGDILGRLKFLEGQAIIPILLSKDVINEVLPLHNSEDLTDLRKTWVRAVFRSQPLEKICEYFGVKIALYFAYLGHYTKSLVLPTVLGIVLWFMSGKDQHSDDLYFVIFASVNVLWATLYLESWKRTSSEHAYNWGTMDIEDELLVEPRPLYHGSIVKSKVTGRLEPHLPAWRRNLFRYFVSGPVILLCLSVVFSVMWGIFALQDWINAKVHKGEHFAFWSFIPKILLAVSIGVLDDIYKKIAYWLNDKENYRLEETYENNLIIKLILFQFVNSFLSLFYIAFYLQDMDRLKDQLAALLITRQVIGNVKEALLPYIVEKVKRFKVGYKMTKDMSPTSLEKQAKTIINKKLGVDTKDKTSSDKQDQPTDLANATPEVIGQNGDSPSNSSESAKHPHGPSKAMQNLLQKEEINPSESGPQLTQAEVESAMKPYEDTFEDHLEMFIQFGYVTLFSSAFPLAALCAFLNNVIEIRSDAFKLCMSLQRPFGQRVGGIGTWQDALEVMSVIAVMVNCALIGMSDLADRLFPQYTAAERILLIVILEHVVLSLKFMLAYAIPDLPHWVAEEKARLEYMRRNALKKLETKNPNSQKTKSVERKQSDPFYRMSLDASNSNRGQQSRDNFFRGNLSSSTSTYSYKDSYQRSYNKDPSVTVSKSGDHLSSNAIPGVPWYSQYRRPSVGTVLGATTPNYGVPARSTFSSTWTSSNGSNGSNGSKGGSGSSGTPCKDLPPKREQEVKAPLVNGGKPKKEESKKGESNIGNGGGFMSIFTNGLARKRTNVPLSTDL